MEPQRAEVEVREGVESGSAGDGAECRRRDSNPRHADYDFAAGVAGVCGC